MSNESPYLPNPDGYLSSKKLANDCKHLISAYFDYGDWKKVDKRLNGTERKRLKRLYSQEFQELFGQIEAPLRKYLLFQLLDLAENSKAEGVRLEANKEISRRIESLSEAAAKSPLLQGNTTITQNTYVLAVESLQQSPLGSQLLSKMLSNTVTDNNTYQSSPLIEHNSSPLDSNPITLPTPSIPENNQS